MRRVLVLALLAPSCVLSSPTPEFEAPTLPSSSPPVGDPVDLPDEMLSPPGGTASSGARSAARVTGVTDGDTVRVIGEGGEERVRLIGIDAPEEPHPDRAGECYARQSTRFLRGLIDRQAVELETDLERRDRFGRLLAYVWLGDRLINEVLVAQGYAVAGTYRPNVRHQDRLENAERSARAESRGLWGAC